MLTFLELNRDDSADTIHVNMSAVAHFSKRGSSTTIEFLSGLAAVTVRQTPDEIYDLLDKVPGNNPGQ